MASGDEIKIAKDAIMDDAGDQNAERAGPASFAPAGGVGLTGVRVSGQFRDAQAKHAVPAAWTGGNGAEGGLEDVFFTAKANGRAGGANGDCCTFGFRRASTYDANKPVSFKVLLDTTAKRAFITFVDGKPKFSGRVATVHSSALLADVFAAAVARVPTASLADIGLGGETDITGPVRAARRSPEFELIDNIRHNSTNSRLVRSGSGGSVVPELPAASRRSGPGRPSHLEVYERLHIQVQELRENLGGLPLPEEAADIWRGLWYEEAHHSTALEGNTLVLRQVERLLAEGRAVGSKDLAEYLEVKGYADASEWVYSQAIHPQRLGLHQQIVTLAEVREVHHAALSPVWEVSPHPSATHAEAPGSYRRHDIHPFPGGMVPVEWPLVDAEMTAWADRVNSLDPTVPIFPEALASTHCRFQQIHPFLDGNGRTGRLVLNLVLVRLGFPPAIIHKRDRDRYLQALRRADAGEPGPLGAMLARAVLDSLYKFVLPAVAGPARLVPLEALATDDITEVALRGAANRGRLQATRGSDGRWRSSRRWVQEYLSSRYLRT